MSRNAYSKSQIFLLEFVIVVLFLSICATICVSAFVKANYTSEENQKKGMAIIAVQSIAESIKSIEETKSGDPIGLVGDTLEKYFGAVQVAEEQGLSASYNIYFDEKFEYTNDNKKAKKMSIVTNYEYGMLTSNIKFEDWCSLTVKKYIPN